MIDILAFVGIGISAFVATNIDDIFILMLFFSSPNIQKGQVVIGQYLGIGMLVIISTVGSLLAFIVPQYLIGLLGLVPISIGIIRLIQLRKSSKPIPQQKTERISRWRQLSMLTVAAVVQMVQIILESTHHFLPNIIQQAK